MSELAAAAFDRKGEGKGRYGGGKLARRGATGAPDDSHAAVMAGLLLGWPEFQRR